MALILAVDPGGSQAQAIEDLAGELRDHELVPVGSCAEAVAALERRAPDLVLLPALLPEGEEAEEATLRARLHAVSGRDFTLTLPVLALSDAAPASRVTGWFRRLRKSGEPADAAGCSPAVFAAQIREYLAAAPAEPHGEAARSEASASEDEAAAERRARMVAAAAAAAAWLRARRTASSAEAAAPREEPSPPPVSSPLPETSFGGEAEGLEEPPAPVPPAQPVWTPRLTVGRPPAEIDPAPESPSEEIGPVALGDGLDDARRPSPASGMTAGAQSFDPWASVETPADVEAREPGLSIILRTPRLSAARWLLRTAILVVLVAAAAVAGRRYWPALSGGFTRGTAVLESVPAGSRVVIDGRAAGVTPLTMTLPAGSHTVVFVNGDASRTRDLVVTAGGRVVERVDWTAKPTGSLQVTSDPAGARVLVDGEFRGSTPVRLDGLAVGTHAVTLESAAGTVRRTITIAAGETADVTELIFSGWLAVFAPFEVELSEGDRPIQLDDRSRVMLSPGWHELRVRNPALRYEEVHRVEIKPSVTTALSLMPPPTTLSVTATEPAEVWVDGTRIGDTPIAEAPIGLGMREIVVRTPGGDERRFVVTATSEPLELTADFSKPQP